ncbi:vitamin K epoxide reductase family protein, partial [Mycobacterium sp.]|uniref:vitamin K epoxide reductase family protein n=1 Tax=Mycobacterium sp. TaxID=1785 RepID=UPI00260BB6BE
MTGAVSTESADPSGDLTPARVPPLSAWWLLIAGVIGLIASMTLTVEKIDILLDSSYVPSCNINPILSCGSVMITPQASLLGFPNPLLGLVAFTVVIVTGLLALT